MSLTSYPGIDWRSSGTLRSEFWTAVRTLNTPAIHGSDMGKEVSYVHICPEEFEQERLGWDPLQRYISDSNITQKKIFFNKNSFKK